MFNFEEYKNRIIALTEEQNPERVELVTTRSNMCEECDIRTDNVCDNKKYILNANDTKSYGCDCMLSTIIMCWHCKCPINKW